MLTARKQPKTTIVPPESGDRHPWPGIPAPPLAWPAVALGLFLAALVITLIVMHAAADFIVLVSVMILLGGLLVYDIFSRRKWEANVVRQITKYTDYHDRLVREVARNRNELATLKEGLADAALTIEAEGRGLSPSSSPEARMIETIVSQLGSLGEKPRADIESRPEGQHVLELEMAPPPAKAPPVSDLDAEFATDFSKLDDATVLEMLRHALRTDAIDVFAQPVVSLPQRKHRMYEVFGRIRAGAGVYLPAAHYLELAQEEHLVAAVDNLLLLRCLQMLRTRRGDDPGMPYILNITGGTLNDRSFMGDLVAFLSEYRRMADNLIFELSQSEFDNLDESVTPILDGLSRLGCRFSMDRVRKRQIDIGLLRARHIRFVKMDAAWLLKEGTSTKAGFSRVVRLKKQLDAAGIDLVVEKIETEDTLRELLDYNIDFGQGYLFGKPSLATSMTGKKKAA